MLNLNLNASEENIVVTLTEKNTSSDPIYHFVFKSVSTNNEVTKDFTPADDLSAFPNRFNEFAINTSSLFSGQTPGQWQYKVIETNTNTLLEQGKMILNGTPLSTIGYQPTVNYQGYGGN